MWIQNYRERSKIEHPDLFLICQFCGCYTDAHVSSYEFVCPLCKDLNRVDMPWPSHLTYNAYYRTMILVSC